MFYAECGGRRARWDWDSFAGAFWGGKPGGRHFRGRMGRVFEQGDLKYVILRLLDEKPRHGYEIIKALEEKSGGAYSPSPGTVYPTLTMLEEMGYARSTGEEGGKRVYEITPEGKKYLLDNMTTVDSIFERITRAVEPFFDRHMLDIHDAMRKVGRATYATAMKHSTEKEMLTKISDILARAAAEIDALSQ